MAPHSTTRRAPAWIHAAAAGLVYALFAAVLFVAYWAGMDLSIGSVAYFIFACAALPAAILIQWHRRRGRGASATTGILTGFKAAVIAALMIPAPFLAHLIAQADSPEVLMMGAFDLILILVGHGTLLVFIAVPIGALVGAVAASRFGRLATIEPHLRPLRRVTQAMVQSAQATAGATTTWASAGISPLKRNLAVVHALSAAGLYLYFHRPSRHSRWDEVDLWLATAAFVAILFFWWVHRRRAMTPGIGALVGLEAAIAGGAAVMIPHFAIWVSTSRHASGEIFLLAIVVVARIAIIACAMIPTGLAVGVVAYMLSRRRQLRS